MNKKRTSRIVLGALCLLGLVLVFVFQRLNVAELLLSHPSATVRFLVNRTIRFLLNDVLAIGLIYSLFEERKYVIFSLWAQLAGVVLFLLPYFIVKIYLPSYNGPLISFLHRLILNPTLLLLLIPAFYYQRATAARE